MRSKDYLPRRLPHDLLQLELRMKSIMCAPSRLLFAALTMASTSSLVISPCLPSFQIEHAEVMDDRARTRARPDRASRREQSNEALCQLRAQGRLPPCRLRAERGVERARQ
jgi:hypothetical protein